MELIGKKRIICWKRIIFYTIEIMKTGILITSYDRFEYLKMTLDSLSKTFLEKETVLCIVDDHSLDKRVHSLINSFCLKDCVVDKVFKEKNKGMYDSLFFGYDRLFNLFGCEYVILLGNDCIVNDYFYDSMVYYKKIFPKKMISGFNTLVNSELGKSRHPVFHDGCFYVVKKTTGSLCSGIDKMIYEKYVKPVLIKKNDDGSKAYDTLSSKNAFEDGCETVCIVPSVCQHIGFDSSMNHSVNVDVACDFFQNLRIKRKKISINIATYPKRIESLKKCVENLLKISEIDVIRIYLNEYDKIPDFLLNDDKIELKIGVENLMDSGKFFWLMSANDEYYFSLDDDILIDASYIKKHIEILKKYDGCLAVSLHGKILKEHPLKMEDLKESFHCLKTVKKNEFVNFPGTGVMALDSSKIKFGMNLFKTHGMADLWVSKYFQDNEIPAVVRKHSSDEISLSYDGMNTLWNNRDEMRSDHSDIFNSVSEWVNFKIDER